MFHASRFLFLSAALLVASGFSLKATIGEPVSLGYVYVDGSLNYRLDTISSPIHIGEKITLKHVILQDINGKCRSHWIVPQLEAGIAVGERMVTILLPDGSTISGQASVFERQNFVELDRDGSTSVRKSGGNTYEIIRENVLYRFEGGILTKVTRLNGVQLSVKAEGFLITEITSKDEKVFVGNYDPWGRLIKAEVGGDRLEMIWDSDGTLETVLINGRLIHSLRYRDGLIESIVTVGAQVLNVTWASSPRPSSGLDFYRRFRPEIRLVNGERYSRKLNGPRITLERVKPDGSDQTLVYDTLSGRGKLTDGTNTYQ